MKLCIRLISKLTLFFRQIGVAESGSDRAFKTRQHAVENRRGRVHLFGTLLLRAGDL